MASTPLLDLTTQTERPTVAIDGVRYALTPAGVLGVIPLFRIDAMRGRITELNAKLSTDQASDEEGREIEDVVDALVRIVLAAPSEVIDKLAFIQKMHVAQAFITLSPQSAQPAIAMATARATTPNRRTGARSPRGSRGFTAAARSTGSPSSRAPSSERV